MKVSFSKSARVNSVTEKYENLKARITTFHLPLQIRLRKSIGRSPVNQSGLQFHISSSSSFPLYSAILLQQYLGSFSFERFLLLLFACFIPFSYKKWSTSPLLPFVRELLHFHCAHVMNRWENEKETETKRKNMGERCREIEILSHKEADRN